MLLVTTGTRTCAIPVRYVVETMRPLPVEVIPDTPAYVAGLAVVRGAPVPVIDLTVLVDPRSSTKRTRFVSIKVDDRRFVLTVDGVLGVRSLEQVRLEALPPLLSSGDHGLIDTIGAADTQLLIVLRAARIVSDEVWARVPVQAEGA